jgi:hypothetical protein
VLTGLNKVIYGLNYVEENNSFYYEILSFATVLAIIVWRIVNIGHIKAECLCFVKHKTMRNTAV